MLTEESVFEAAHGFLVYDHYKWVAECSSVKCFQLTLLLYWNDVELGKVNQKNFNSIAWRILQEKVNWMFRECDLQTEEVIDGENK